MTDTLIQIAKDDSYIKSEIDDHLKEEKKEEIFKLFTDYLKGLYDNFRNLTKSQKIKNLITDNRENLKEFEQTEDVIAEYNTWYESAAQGKAQKLLQSYLTENRSIVDHPEPPQL